LYKLRDAFEIIKDINDFKKVIEIFSQVIKPISPDYIVGIESRGFILASVLSHVLNIPLVLIRKKNKLPGPCEKISYELHYGQVLYEYNIKFPISCFLFIG
jgi:adenine phosphoribosyltransferase